MLHNTQLPNSRRHRQLGVIRFVCVSASLEPWLMTCAAEAFLRFRSDSFRFPRSVPEIEPLDPGTAAIRKF